MPESACPASVPMPTEGILSAFGHGEERTGVALGNSIMCSAQVLETIPNYPVDFRFTQISRLVGGWRSVSFVVGMSVHPDGEEQPMVKPAKCLGNRLYGHYGLLIIRAGERCSSIAAQDAGTSDDVLGVEVVRAIF